MHIMVVNCGSSSLKFQLIRVPSEEVIAKGNVERIGQKVKAQFLYAARGTQHEPAAITAQDHTQAITYVINALTSGATAVLRAKEDIAAFGHRVVHGGEQFTGSVIITDEVVHCIEECCALAPLHNPANLAGIRACQNALPCVPNIAVFDTAFHQTMPSQAFHYAIPYEYYQRDRIRRYGFHGTSHRYVTEAFAALTKKPLQDVNVVTCHLGNGSSLTAVQNGRSVDTSMGFTPLQGVIMGTRCGDIDPAVVFHLMSNDGLSADAINTILNKQSGLLGFTGISSDMRDIQGKAAEGNARAALVLDMWAYGIAKYIAAYVAVLPRTDALIFTAGIGENSSEARTLICAKAPGLGIELDAAANAQRGAARCISTPASRIPVWVIPTNEELEIARETYELVHPQ
jgi:acetate kinase